MLKTVDGLEMMTGTSKGSLYPVYFWANDVCVGVQIHLVKAAEGRLVYALYGRAQVFDKDGNDVVPTLEQLYKALPGGSFKLASKYHLSGMIFQTLIDTSKVKSQTPEAIAEAVSETHVKVVSALAKQLHMTKLKDKFLTQLCTSAYFDHVGHKPAPDIHMIMTKMDEDEGKLDPSFDVLSMLGKSAPK